ncbi:aspartate/tyrosine/aromatic aminotransferase [Caldisphaera lagunensis DSM 15908]|uniref:Aminotransferase n=2 Tax=Caldisphaera lagunensis TaxID=200415 RepID=L0ABV5_CALLD|nr:aspartate/tyrosine/aromatic aminotransferase [Caldisphaera lagunensis DSM 15908]
MTRMSINPPVMDMQPNVYLIEGESAFSYLPIIRKLQNQGKKVISFGIGQPDFPTPDHIKNAAKAALDDNFTGYTETQGIPELREAVANYLNSRYGSDVKSEEVIVTPGSKTAIFMAAAAYIRQNDEAIIIEPSYYAYAQVVKLFGGIPKFVSLDFDPNKGFSLNVEKIEKQITNHTRMIFVNNPHNPTGAVFSRDQLDQLVELARKKNIILVADEIYDNLIYRGSFKSLISYSEWRDNLLYINGFSKTFSMTGWRLAYLVARKELMPRFNDLAVSLYSCATSFVQKAGVIALNGDWTPVKNMAEEFNRRAQVLYTILKNAEGFEPYLPQGAFYMFPRISSILRKTNLTVKEFVNLLLEKAGVLVLPGDAFPDKAGKEFVRFSYATSMESIKEGAERIVEFTKDIFKK